MSYTLHKDVLAKSISYGGSRSASAIKYIVIHYTGNKTDKALSNAKYYRDSNQRSAGAHYFVDDNSVYESISPLKIAWAVGGAKYSNCSTTGGGSKYGVVTNSNSVSIEMCSTNGKISDATYKNTVALTKKLMKEYNVPASHVVRHFDVTGKPCPGWDGWIGKNESFWKKFKKDIAKNGSSSSTKSNTSDTPRNDSKGSSSDSKTVYYKSYTGRSSSLVEALIAVGAKEVTKAYRAKIAVKNGLCKTAKGYTGSAEMNTKMLELLKKGKLINPQ